MFDDFDDDDPEDLEDFDEADLLTGEAHGLAPDAPPRENPACYGHEALEKMLIDMIHAGRLPHAVILSGLRGTGKATFAFRLARYLLKHGTAASGQEAGLFGETLPQSPPATMDIAIDDPVFRQVASGGHPDLLTISRKFDDKKSREKSSIETDEIRKITPFMRMTASQGGWRVVIIDDADTMNRNAQNALLKILEEPPANSILILVCHRAGAMIPTIRSRCRTFPMALPGRDIFGKLAGSGLSEEETELLYRMAGGSIGRARDIVAENGLETVSKIINLFYSWPEWPWTQIHLIADNLSRPGQEKSLAVFQECFLWIIETILSAKARGVALPYPLNNDAARTMSDHYSLAAWIEISGQIKDHFDKVDRAALDKRHAVIGAFSFFNRDRKAA